MVAKRQEYVYVVKQTDPENDYNNTCIAVYSGKRLAVWLARELNKKYGKGCVFDKNWDFVEYDMKDEPHYYEVESFEVSPRVDEYL